jgi:nucleoside-diphosphate-sugar epimerase
MSSESVIFVTGANGFLGSHIIHQLLEKGYRVRGTARGAKVSVARDIFASYDKFEVVSVDDLAVDDISVHLKDVNAVIHAAAPLPSATDSKGLLQSALNGSLNVIRQAEKAGIKRVVYTSSIVTLYNASGTFTENDWNPMTEEETLAGSPFAGYIGAKTVAERAVWKFADEHKNIDITGINPPYLFGPFAPGFLIPEPNYATISTNIHLYQILSPKGVFPRGPGSVDVRDVARIHVEALHSPPESSVGRKRLIVSSPYDGSYKQAVQFVAEAHPELKARLVDPDNVPKFAVDKIAVDLQRVADVTGVQVDSYHSWKDTVLNTIDALLALEKEWVSKGYKVEVPSPAAYGFA